MSQFFLAAQNSIDSWLHWFRDLLKAWRGPIVLFAVVIGVPVLIWNFVPEGFEALTANNQRIAITAIAIFALVFLILVIAFFWVFRGIKADEDNLNAIITYCHTFIMFSLAVSFLPFMAFPLIPGLYNFMVESPIGIVAGCSVPVPSNVKPVPSVPIELRCNTESDQWVVNIGGRTNRPTASGTTTPSTTTPGTATPGTTTPGTTTPGEKKADPQKTHNVEIYNVEIKGGLVVPLYAIVLSLMGAAVSMTRRVPEYQRRLSPGDAEFLSYDKAREFLVFQIMQVVSAPLIVVTAYYLVDPGSRSSTIVLSFVSGFSSETVLLLIRSIMDKLKPGAAEVPAKPPSVTFAPPRLDFGKVPKDKPVTKSVTITNRGLAPLIVSRLMCNGEFSTATTVPVTIQPGSNEIIEIEFKPTSAGSKQGQLTVVDDAPGTPRTVDLTGTGV